MIFIEDIPPDGSDRVFQRVFFNDKKAILIKPSNNPQGFNEAKSYYYIGSHLYRKSIPVPCIYQYDEQRGYILAEDLGDVKLYDVIIKLKDKGSENGILYWYEKAVRILVRMQLDGKNEFDTSWCYDSPYYDQKLAYERECLYFTNCFLGEYLGIKNEKHLHYELEKFSQIVNNFERKFLLHRDFQSRNLMVKGDEIKIIDFQGARLGPLGYDLASLLIDPYTNIKREFWINLIEIYLNELKKAGIIIEFNEFFHNEFLPLAILRNMQILGAFSFLSMKKNKPFFKGFISKAYENLCYLIDIYEPKKFLILNEIIYKIKL